MAGSESPISSPNPSLSSPKKENIASVGSRIAELGETRSELLGRIQGLKQDLQVWRSKLDTQVKVYRDELQELKKSLNDEVEILRTEFKDLRTTLQQQQDDVTASLKNLGLDEGSEDVEKVDPPKFQGNGVTEDELPKENGKKSENSTSSGPCDDTGMP